MAEKVIQPLSQARREIAGSNLTNKGKKMYMLHWRSHILSNQCKKLLTASSCKISKSNDSLYEWYNEDSGETMQDGLMVAILIMSKMSPDVKQNVFNLLKDMKKIQPINFKFDMNQWSSKMEITCASIEKKIPNIYYEKQFLMDFFNVVL